jgi:hypothetical protein
MNASGSSVLLWNRQINGVWSPITWLAAGGTTNSADTGETSDRKGTAAKNAATPTTAAGTVRLDIP